MTTRRPELPIIPFASRQAWETWLEEHHASSDGLWLKFAKKDSGIETVSFAEALDLALCYGWIGSVHPAPAEEQVVEGQPRQGEQTDRGRQDETRRS